MPDSEDKNTQVDFMTVITSLLKKNDGDTNKTIQMLLQENYDYREKNRTLKAELKKSEEKLPVEGSVILKKEDYETFEKYKALGKTEDIEKLKNDHETLIASHSALQKDLVLTEISELHKYNKDILTDIVKARNLNLEIGSEKGEDGNTKKTGFVVIDEKTKVRLEDYAKDNLQAYAPSLVRSDVENRSWIKQDGNSGQGSGKGKSDLAAVVLSKYEQKKTG